MRMNLQFFGGRGSAGGNAKPAGETLRMGNYTYTKMANGKYRTTLNGKRVADRTEADVKRIFAGEVKKPTADERNKQELARVNREVRLSGANDLNKGQTYEIQWGKNKTVTGTYIGGKMINGVAVRDFRGSDGKLYRVDNDDIKSSVREIRKRR